MIGDPPLVTLQTRIERPTPAQLAPFIGQPTGFVVDAQMGQGALDPAIKPLLPDCAFAGPALTVACGPRDNLGLLVALEVAQPGDVIAVAADGFATAAVVGDHVAAMARNKGIAAIVVDGMARDLDGLLAVGLPVCARGITPNSGYKTGPCALGTPIVLGGIAVHSGDLLVGDRDGVVVVARAALDTVAAQLAEVRAKEDAMGAAIAAGMTAPDWVRELLASDRVRRVD